MRRGLFRLLLAAMPLLSLASCAYYNTMFMAKRYYYQATNGRPYSVDKPEPASVPTYNKSIDYSKKLIANYSKSKWVDDAYLLWARGLIGKDDPTQTVDMLREFNTRYPNSGLKAQATFYRGVAYRHAHKYSDATASFDEYLRVAPKGDLVPYALLEQSRALMSLKRPNDAAVAAGKLVDNYPKHTLQDRALRARAEALLAQGHYQEARADYHTLGTRADTDDQRFEFLLNEADCLEAGHEYENSLALLRDALSHEREPVLSDTTGKVSTYTPPVPGGNGDRWGRLTMRVGSANLMMGRKEEALRSYNEVLLHYFRTPLAAEAQYRIGYVYEVLADDFDGARTEYAKVRNQSAASAFTVQANERSANLERLARYRTASGDSVAREAEAGFARAELYLFQLDKPDRAYEEYNHISVTFPGTPYDAKAKVAQAWVLKHKFGHVPAADSLLWLVVFNHPATEAQLAARDFLEADGQTVPDSLIKMPERPAVVDSVVLTPPPETSTRLGIGAGQVSADSLTRLGLRPNVFGAPPSRPNLPADSLARAPATAPTDSLSQHAAPARPDSGGPGSPTPAPGSVPPAVVGAAPVVAPVPARRDSLP